MQRFIGHSEKGLTWEAASRSLAACNRCTGRRMNPRASSYPSKSSNRSITVYSNNGASVHIHAGSYAHDRFQIGSMGLHLGSTASLGIPPYLLDRDRIEGCVCVCHTHSNTESQHGKGGLDSVATPI